MKLNYQLIMSNSMLNDEIYKTFNKNNTKNKSSQLGLTCQPHDLGNETGTTQ